ncbi:MAG TPA: nuclear transport factor 2 family protein [Sphingomonadaceae bacterium]|nr:nuclear transport factor 2 family protein [Sphingomonadaceae bacterium]
MPASAPPEISRRALLLAGGAAWLAGHGLRPGTANAAATSAKPDAAVLSARLADIRAVREIKRLQHCLGHYAEAGQWTAMAALFARDGVYEAAPVRHKGHAAIAAYFRETMGDGKDGLAPDRLNIQLFLSPVITVAADGRTAKGRWHQVSMTGRKSASAEWAGGIHENDYILTPEGWRIAAIHFHRQFAGPYATGWHNIAAETPLVPYHYTPDEAGTPVPHDRRDAEPLPSPKQMEGEADLLLAASAAQNLQAAFGFYLDRKMWDNIADLFGATGEIDIAGVGRYIGPAGIRRALTGLFGPTGLVTGELNDRPQLMPVVTVAPDGRSATVRNIEIGMTGRHGSASYWSMAVQQFRCIRSPKGVWTIASLQRTPRMRCDFKQG